MNNWRDNFPGVSFTKTTLQERWIHFSNEVDDFPDADGNAGKAGLCVAQENGDYYYVADTKIPQLYDQSWDNWNEYPEIIINSTSDFLNNVESHQNLPSILIIYASSAITYQRVNQGISKKRSMALWRIGHCIT